MAAAFDVHEHRHELKLLRDAGDSSLYENRDGVSCPSCGDRFDTLYLTAEPTASFDPDEAFRFCLLRGEERLYVFTH